LWQGQDPRMDAIEGVQRQADVARTCLAEVGLPPVQVRPVLALAGRDLAPQVVAGVTVVGGAGLSTTLLREGKHLTVREIEELSRKIMILFPPQQHPEPSPPQGSPEQVPLFDQDELEQAALEAAMRAPLEDWMVFLHPRQADFARRRFSGPALLRGAAGTGKTVVALHRLAYLAERRTGSLLFLSYVKTLPAVQRAAYERLSPRTVGRVHFASLHSWPYNCSPGEADESACGLKSAFAPTGTLGARWGAGAFLIGRPVTSTGPRRSRRSFAGGVLSRWRNIRS
jgi:hypothetical protein